MRVQRFKVLVEDVAEREISEIFSALKTLAPTAAVRWLSRLETSIESLSTFPNRFGLARESEDFDEEIRQLLHGRRPNIYRVLYVVRGLTVHVLHVRHAARQNVQRGNR